MFALDLAILTCCEKKYIKSQIFTRSEPDWHLKSVDLFVEKTVLQFNKGVFFGWTLQLTQLFSLKNL